MRDRTFSQHPHFDVAVIDYPHSFDIQLSQWGPDYAFNSVFHMTLPEHVQVTSAEYVINNGASGACTVGTEVVCQMGTIPFNGATFKGVVSVNVVGVTEGYGEYTASLTADGNEDNPIDNSFTQTIYVGKSLKPFQDQIDAAVGPIVINLDPGMYIGSLNFSDKQVELNGSTGAGATYVRTDSPIVDLSQQFIATSNSSLKNIHFVGREHDELSLSQVTLYGANILIENNVFEGDGYNTVGIEGYGDVLTIQGNIFHNSHTSSVCTLIKLEGNGSYRIENNLMYDTGCIAMDIRRFSYMEGEVVTHVVTNNTIVNNYAAIMDSVVYGDSASTIQNNIIANNTMGINVLPDDSLGSSGPYSLPEVSNNLFYANGDDVVISSDLSLSFEENGSNLFDEPGFVDAAAADFRLKFDSPAIDSGTETDRSLFDFDNTARPVDGNLDSTVRTDIGAFEYH